MKPLPEFRCHATLRSIAGACLFLSAAFSQGADVYWNNTSLNWNTSTATWNSAPDNSGTTNAWTNGDSAVFSAGTALTSNYTLTNGGVTVDNITQQEGRVRITSGTLTMADTSMIIDTQTRVGGDYDLRIDSVIANSSGGASSLTKNGSGALLFSGVNNTFTGGVTLNSGILGLEVGATGTISHLGAGTVTLAGGTFIRSYANTGVHLTTSNTLDVTGNVTIGAYQQNNGNWILSGNWNAGTTSGNFNVANSTLAGYTGSGAPSATTIFVTGDVSAYTGTFSHNNLATGGNRLRFGSQNAGNVMIDAAKAKFMTSGSTAGGNVLDVADGTYGTMKMGELAGTGGRIRAGWASAGNTTFEVGALNTSSRFSGLLDDNINGSNGKAALAKTGTGALELGLSSGNNYSGGTNVSNGTLVVNNTTGSGTGSGSITINGGTLAGSGRIVPTGSNGISVSTGIIAPGGAVSATTGGSFSQTIGTLGIDLGSTTGQATMGSGTSFAMELGSPGASISLVGSSDLVSLLNASASDFAFNANVVNFGGTGGIGFYKLFNTSLDATTWSGLTYSGTTGIVSSGLTYSNLASGLSGQFIVGGFSSGGDAGDIYLQVVPEPAAALMGGLAFVCLLRRRRY